jgi:hypothetical protein
MSMGRFGKQLTWICWLVVASCGSEPRHAFSPAAIPVDKSKRMADLTAVERTAMCSELTRSLTSSFGSRDVACAFGSHSGTREGMPTCQSWYDGCLNNPKPTGEISGCTDAMADMWACPITAGQYEACFNAFNALLLDLTETTPICQSGTGQPPAMPQACVSAPCDYVWFD